MRQKLKSVLYVAISLGIPLASVLALCNPRAMAAGGSFSVGLSATSASIGSTVTATFYISPSSNIDTVDGSLSYDAAKLTVQSVSCASGFFDYQPPPGCPTSGNPLRVASAKLGGSTSSKTVIMTVVFKAISAGSATITGSGNTDYQGSNFQTPTSGSAIVAVSTPSCPAGYSGTYPSCSPPAAPASPSSPSTPANTAKPNTNSGTGGGSSTPAKTTGTGQSTPAASSGASPAKPSAGGPVSATATITDSKVQYSTANFAITTAQPSQVYIQYGLSKDALIHTTEPDALGTSHNVALDQKLVTPGETYYYTVVTKDANGAITSSSVQSFTAKGMTVSVGVFDKNHQPLKRQKVTLHSNPSTATTDDKGYAVFSNVIPGDHHLSYTSGEQEYKQPLTVTNNITVKDGEQVAPTQQISIVYGLVQSKRSPIPVVVGTVLVGILAAGAVFVLRNRRHTPVPAVATSSSSPINPVGPVATATISNTPFIREAAPVAPVTPAMPATTGPIEAKPTIDAIESTTEPRPGSMFTPTSGGASEDKHDGGL